MLYDLVEHFEDCYHIACALFPKSASRAAPPLRKFKAAMRVLRDQPSNIVNAIKHRQARLAHYEVFNSIARLSGYSVHVMVEPGVVGPDTMIHGYSSPGKLPGISFNHDLKKHLSSIYVVGQLLADLVDTVFDSASRLTSPPTEKESECPWAFELAERIAKLPPFVYPHEVHPPVPLVNTAQDRPSQSTGALGSLICLGFSNQALQLTLGQIPGGHFSVATSYTGDGVTRSFRLP